MTKYSGVAFKKKRKKQSLIIFIVCCFFCLFYRNDLTESIIFGMKLAGGSVIPSLFPFFVISDYLSKNIDYGKSGYLSLFFEKLFGIPKEGFTAFILGNVCGFPLGVRCAAELYTSGVLTKDECERLCAIANNPSLAFSVSVVGAAMLGSFLLGVVLYLSILLSSIIIGIALRKKSDKISNKYDISRQSFDISESIKNAGISSITVSSYIIFFSGVIGIAKRLLKTKPLIIIASMLSEVGNAAALLTSSDIFTSELTLSLLGAALGFSGLSVHLQAFSFLPREISRKRYLVIKASEGVMAFVISYFVSFLVL